MNTLFTSGGNWYPVIIGHNLRQYNFVIEVKLCGLSVVKLQSQHENYWNKLNLRVTKICMKQ